MLLEDLPYSRRGAELLLSYKQKGKIDGGASRYLHNIAGFFRDMNERNDLAVTRRNLASLCAQETDSALPNYISVSAQRIEAVAAGVRAVPVDDIIDFLQKYHRAIEKKYSL